MDVAEQKNDSSEPTIRCEQLREYNGDSSTNRTTSSDDIVKDLLNEVRHLEKPFTVEDLTSKKKDKEKKKSKEHKHKKSKKKKKKHRSKRDRSGSRKRSRSRSKSKKKHRKRSRSRSRSNSKSRSKSGTPSRIPTPLKSESEEDETSAVKKEPEVTSTPEKSPSFPEKSSIREISDEDDLPVGADFRTVMKEAKKKINISSKIGSSLDLAALPVAPPLAKPRSSHAFPLSKTSKKDEDDDLPLHYTEKRESDVLNKVIAEKGRGDFIPRNLKVKTAVSDSLATQSQPKTEDIGVDMKPSDKLNLMDVSADETEKDEEFGPSSLPPKFAPTTSSAKATESGPAPEPISDGELEKEIAEEINAAAQPKSTTKSSRLEKIVESSSALISKNVSRETSRRKRRRSPRKRSASPNTDEELRIRARNARSSKVMKRVASPPRPRGRRRDDRERRSKSRRRYSRSKSRSRSYDRYRRRSRSRTRSRSKSHSNDRYRSRRSRSRSSARSRSRSRSSSPSRSRSRSLSRSRSPRSPRRDIGGGARRRTGGGGRNKRGRIDKAKLLAIARKKAQKMQLLGINLGSLDQMQNQPKSVDDFVSYCQQIQRRQDKEDRREKGENVSSDDEPGKSGSGAASPTSFKHPFGVKTTGQGEGIKINIVNATTIPTKTPQERILDNSQLRLVYPVSSGVTHKENTLQERDKWTPVVKTELKTCSLEQKKYVGITSLEAQKYHSSISSVDHLLPPPPAPPILTGLGGLLPPPPPPPKLTAFDTLLPPPPPLPELLVVPPEEEMIIHEPDKIEAKTKDVSKVLAQRASAQLALTTNPNDFEAIRMLKEADDQMAAWAAAKNLPGKFTGSTGLNVLSSNELQPQDPRFNAWVKKDEDVDVQA
ncbi:hypothetical protein RB195_004779 [Necator americanus]|uniref:Protein SON n=1 Tax=Necator americanus TaxID=51031 RepID=A0ABR1BMX8_NECAM